MSTRAPLGGVESKTVTIRRLRPEDSISEITMLLHRAYRPQVEMGLRPLAGRQDDSITADRAANSECWLAVIAGARAGRSTDERASAGQAAPDAEFGPDKIVGVILFEEKEKVDFPPFFLRPDVCHFAQFGVDPTMQGMGIGRLLLEKVEERAKEKDAAELALSMAEPDQGLLQFYVNRGFRLVEYWQWPYTNYRSCILSKKLTSGV